jgi:DNA helicase II / ATP-dependent DNA helicase PcrA
MFCLEDHDLNDEQKAAIAVDGNIFLIACPGSGKTRTLTFKIANELTRLESTKQFIVAITYTHRAADEIHERIERLGIDTSQLWIGTIHSFCLEWILKPYFIYHPKISHGFRVIDSHDKEQLLDALCAGYPKITHWDCDFYFTKSDYSLGCADRGKHDALHQIIGEYLKTLERNRQIDFELVLRYAYELLIENPPISEVLSNIFSHILIDEYQDTKEIQYEIVAAILKAGCGKTRTFIVGDPNQAIFESLGGFAIPAADFEAISGLHLTELPLSKNYRSSVRIVEYFRHFRVFPSEIDAVSGEKAYPSKITYDTATSREEVEEELARLIRRNIEIDGVSPNEVCVIAPWWIHLASVTRKLALRLPQYQFDGPGLVPFARDADNFWYRLSKIVLTEPSPSMYVTRLRWAREILADLAMSGLSISHIKPKRLLRECNSIEIAESDGLSYLHKFFDRLFTFLGSDFATIPRLKDHHDAFFASSRARIDRLRREGSEGIADIAMFRRVFASRSGITVSTIHGVKGAEYDTVIAYALLEGMLPHFSDPNPTDSARKLLYVIASRARKNLHLISETGRSRGWRGDYDPTEQLVNYKYNYDALS